jgi:TorA maturation chaperone TorD
LYVPNDDDTVAILQSLANSYQEYSAAMTQSYHNRIDYAGVELDFMRYLCELEDEALQNNQVELAIGYSKAAASFFASHPSRWMGSFCTEALKYAQTGFFHGYLNLVKQITSEETIFVILQNLDKQEGLHE